MLRTALVLVCLAITSYLGRPATGQGIDADFQPELAGVELTSRRGCDPAIPLR